MYSPRFFFPYIVVVYEPINLKNIENHSTLHFVRKVILFVVYRMWDSFSSNFSAIGYSSSARPNGRVEGEAAAKGSYK